ncbi:MAG: transporter [Frankiales bacterium]|nr:transporter [Frankiales bacterium]
MITRYRAAFTPPGAVAFSAAGFVARFSIAIYPIALVLIISAQRGEYGIAGLVSGAYVLGGGVGNPIVGTLVDRVGQRRVLLPSTGLHVICGALLALLIELNTATWTLLLPAALMGFFFVNIGALIRARWSYVWPGGAPQRSTAYSLESAFDELVFVLGPLAATLLATHADPVIALVLAMILVVAGAYWLAGQSATEPPVVQRPAEGGAGFALRYKGMLAITGVMVCMGGVFGSAEVVMVAFCGQHGQRASAGWVVACFAGGSGLAGLAYGSRHWKSPLLRRFVITSTAFSVLPLLFLTADSPAVLALCAGVVGIGVAPTLIAGFGLVDSIVPDSALTEGLTWIGTGLSLGYGIGAALVGGIADAHGAHFAFLVPAGSALVGGALAILLGAQLRTTKSAAPWSSAPLS